MRNHTTITRLLDQLDDTRGNGHSFYWTGYRDALFDALEREGVEFGEALGMLISRHECAKTTDYAL